MLEPWLKRILQIVGTLALGALVVIVCLRTDWSKSFSPDGVLTLVAGVIAFVAVIIQIRSSSKQVRDQIKAQRETEREEQEREKRAVASALSAEIDDFYKFFLKGLWEQRTKVCGPIALSMKPPAELGPVPSTAFLVYRSTAHQLGLLRGVTVRSVVSLYNFTASFVDHYEMYRKAWSPMKDFDDPELATKLRDIFDALPSLILDSDRTCELLAKEQEIPYDGRGFGVARIREADGKGETPKQVLESEAASARKRLSDRYGSWHSDTRG
jgi:hypothetical protein